MSPDAQGTLCLALVPFQAESHTPTSVCPLSFAHLGSGVPTLCKGFLTLWATSPSLPQLSRRQISHTGKTVRKASEPLYDALQGEGGATQTDL